MHLFPKEFVFTLLIGGGSLFMVSIISLWLNSKGGNILRRVIFSIFFIVYTSYALWAHFNYNPKPVDPITVYKAWKKNPPDLNQIHSGDLVLRHGKGFISSCMLPFNNKEPKFSHSGIIHRENGKIYVYNSIGGESRESNAMCMDRFEIFVHPELAFNFGIYRYDLDQAHINRFDSLLTAYYNQKLEFDLDFDMRTDEKMYCSEMIYKALIFVSKDQNYLPLSRVLEKPYVAIDDLYLNQHCNLILEYNYDQDN